MQSIKKGTKITAEINGIESRKIRKKKVNNTKSWVFEKINTMNKLPAN